MNVKIFREKRKTKKLADSCRYNDGVVCVMRDHCKKCGWNPKVTEARLDVIMRRIYEENPALYELLTGE